MKRLLSLLLILLLTLSLCACGEAAETGEAPAPEEESGQTAPDGDKSEQTAPPEETAVPAVLDEDELPMITDGETSPADAVPTLGGETVTLDGISSYLRLELPEGWTWAQAGGTEEGTVYGLWPEDDPSFKVELHWWPEGFAMCGTGVTIQDYPLPDGRTATLAYEIIDEDILWTLILPEAPDSFTIQFSAKLSVYEAHRQELELMLGSLRQGVLAGLNPVNPGGPAADR